MINNIMERNRLNMNTWPEMWRPRKTHEMNFTCNKSEYMEASLSSKLLIMPSPTFS